MQAQQSQYDENAAYEYELRPEDIAGVAFSAIPVAGPYKDAVDDFNNGDYLWAAVNGIFTVVDVVTLGSDTEVSSPVKAGIKSARTVEFVISKMRNGFRKTLAEAGKLRPGDQAHHIVEQGDGAAAQAQKLLLKHNVGIHSSANGMGLSRHMGRHSNLYSRTVLNRLKGLDSKEAIEKALDRIGQELRRYDDEGKTLEEWARDQL